MEIINYGSLSTGYDEYNSRVYDYFLHLGQRIYCVAADDNHDVGGEHGKRHYDAFGGFVMIKAEKLEYKTITDALLCGEFYASEGPSIYDLWVENGEVHITTSPADKITMQTGSCHGAAAFAEDESLTEATFKLRPADRFIRFTVTDASGKRANTGAYFLDDIFGEDGLVKYL